MGLWGQSQTVSFMSAPAPMVICFRRSALPQNVLTVATHDDYYFSMREELSSAEVNIHLRARAQDRALIDQAAGLVGANRSQFMMASALKEAKNILLDQTTLSTDCDTFQKVMDFLDAVPTTAEEAGMRRILDTKTPW